MPNVVSSFLEQRLLQLWRLAWVLIRVMLKGYEYINIIMFNLHERIAIASCFKNEKYFYVLANVIAYNFSEIKLLLTRTDSSLKGDSL